MLDSLDDSYNLLKEEVKSKECKPFWDYRYWDYSQSGGRELVWYILNSCWAKNATQSVSSQPEKRMRQEEFEMHTFEKEAKRMLRLISGNSNEYDNVVYEEVNMELL